MTDTNPETRGVSRRTVASGLAWTAPAVAVAAAAPALAGSKPALTATGVTPQAFVSRYYYVTSDCSVSGGFIDTQGSTPTGGPRSSTGAASGDGLLSPTSSVGYWLESTTGTSGTAQINSITTVYTFSNPIVIDACPNGSYNQGGSATWKWTECTTLNGWTYTLSADGKRLTLTYNLRTTVNTSTSTARTGTYVPGYFINYRVQNSCQYYSSTTVSTSHTMTYSTATYPTGTTWTKNVASRAI